MADDAGRPIQDFVPRFEHIASLEHLEMQHFGGRLTLGQISANLLHILSQITGAHRWQSIWIHYPLSTDLASLLTYLQHIESSRHVERHTQLPGFFHNVLTQARTYLQHIESTRRVERHTPGLGFLSGFQDSLAKGVFTQFPPDSVKLTIALKGESTLADNVPSLITSIINILFAPCLDSGVMRLVVDESLSHGSDDDPFVEMLFVWHP